MLILYYFGNYFVCYSYLSSQPGYKIRWLFSFVSYHICWLSWMLWIIWKIIWYWILLYFIGATPWVFSAQRLHNAIHSHVQEGLLASCSNSCNRLTGDYGDNYERNWKSVAKTHLFASFTPKTSEKCGRANFAVIFACAAQCNGGILDTAEGPQNQNQKFEHVRNVSVVCWEP